MTDSLVQSNEGRMQYFLIILFFILVLFLVVWPVQWAARMMKARNTGFWMCLLALVAATVLHGLGLLAPAAGLIVACLLSAAGFAAILGTDYLRGIGIAILHFIFSAMILALLSLVFGISLAGLMAGL